MLHQAGLRNFIAVVIDMEKLTAADRISGHRSFSFDAHIEDMYPVLTLGGSFHIMPTEIRKDLALIRQFLIDHQISPSRNLPPFPLLSPHLLPRWCGLWPLLPDREAWPTAAHEVAKSRTRLSD